MAWYAPAMFVRGPAVLPSYVYGSMTLCYGGLPMCWYAGVDILHRTVSVNSVIYRLSRLLAMICSALVVLERLIGVQQSM